MNVVSIPINGLVGAIGIGVLAAGCELIYDTLTKDVVVLPEPAFSGWTTVEGLKAGDHRFDEDDQIELAQEADQAPEPEPTTTESVALVKNVFGENVVVELDDLDNRPVDEPYIITVDEYMENVNDWRQETLTYYVGDDIVADAQDAPIYNYSSLMGSLKFGHGSNDNNVVYIRNPKVQMEWEVLKHMSSFEIEVLGHTLEAGYEEGDIKHSNTRKFRMD